MDSNNVTPADIANLISTAGSPEAVIIHLLKEKQHAATQNAQLWKLVDKQRTMLLALNKDLERSIRDKEKYRKRLKEAQNNPLPISVNAKKETYTANNDTTQGRVIHSRETNRPEDSQNTGDPINPSPISQETDIDHQTPTDSNPDSASHGTDSPETQLPFEVKANTNSDGTGQQGTLSQHATQVDQDAFRTNHYDAYKSSVDAPAKIPHPVRKPPPAPLKLDEARKVRPHILLDDRKASSDSEYDEIMEDSEIPKMERGRRKTREEDDRLREAVMLKEQEIRSRSSKKKLKQLESLESNQKDQVQTFLNVGLPASPRSAMSGSPFRNPAAVHSPPDSISNVLQSGARDFSLSDKSRMTSPLSPGLPQSPRPADRPLGSPMPRFPKDLGSLVSPPASPRILTEGQYQNMLVPTSSSQTVPVDTPQDNTQEKGDPAESKPEKVDDSVPTYKLTVEKGSPVSASETSHTIYHGLVSAEYPDLLLPPSALPSIDVKVSSSRLRPSRSSYLALRPIEEEPVFTLSVRSRGSQTELWRVEKAIIALPQLDQQIKQICNFSTKLPERSIFSGHSPAKVDARRVALNAYFESLLTYPMDEATSLVVCQFLTADAIEPRDDESNLLHGPGNGKPPISFGPDGKPRMEGYLTKRGKNFGGWKSRYFVLNGPELRYYESPGGPHLGTIKIQHAQIGKQSPSGKSQSPSRTDDDSENQYRHAFLVLEPKKRDTSALVRHVLCAESDKERDIWVETLLCYVEPREMDDESHSHHPQVSKQGPPRARLQPAHPRKMTWENSQPGPTETLQALSYDDVIAAEAPVLGPGGGKISSNGFHAEQVDRPSGHDNSPTHKSISGPTNAMRIQDAGAWGNKTVTSTKEKKRSIWGFRAAAGVDFAGQGIRQDSVGSLYDDFLDRKGPVRPVFGLPLADAVVFCGPSGLDCGLPAVVYRCLQYLRAQNAELEEGIFRLSGSNVVIRALKERFNTEGDLNFLEGDSYYDVHAVASLFKQYLRELPTTVLTKELHLEFIRVLGKFLKHRVPFLYVLIAHDQTWMKDSKRLWRSIHWSGDFQDLTLIF